VIAADFADDRYSWPDTILLLDVTDVTADIHVALFDKVSKHPLMARGRGNPPNASACISKCLVFCPRSACARFPLGA
jgi:hypothetical protein